MRKFLCVVTLILLLLAMGCNSNNGQNAKEEESLKIVASTSWTAYMAEAAGAKNVTILAPIELRHPPEYDFKPSDVQAVLEADWVILAGYESFMKKIIEGNNIPEEKIICVITTNTYNNLVEQTRIIAEKLGTTKEQQKWEDEFTQVMEEILAKAEEKGVNNIKVLVHQHHQAFIRSLGYDVLEVFSADELSPAKIGELASLGPNLIIDNYHNPQGKTIAETIDVPRVELRNFPGPEHENLIQLIIDNAKKLGLYE
ncbi:hypothetical protein [Anaerobranca gottschalkii]|uniref:Iron/zinc/copper transport system substrate-binding protein n=1 Tax=Anaerobranca gottschalkii DSM 13577 TaxID=1120990 RepID=A0A1I0AN72_9FIRM|nr:hypothetical protein [Anaerobranca gottschalkii]SES94856.1 iron/zinc/copper transport system substrate-binding protein [Anaerobranca gottschalkii DSM 13577]